MKYVVNVSGGLTSFEALRRTIERYGKENTHPVFADTLAEDADLYRFLADQERYFCMTFHRAVDGRTPWQVMKDEGYITMHYPGGTVAPCSRILKREIIDSQISALYKPGEYTRVFGYEWSEIDRMEGLRESIYPQPVWFPLCEPPYIDKCHISTFLESIGIAVPQMYKDGFEHNNCAGECVKAGQAHYANLFFTRSDRYMHAEEQEEELRQYLGKDISILKDRRGGVTKPMTLRAFRLRLESGDTDYDKNDWGGCGCFAPIAQERMGGMLLITDVKRPPRKVRSKHKRRELEQGRDQAWLTNKLHPLQNVTTDLVQADLFAHDDEETCESGYCMV
ncbi:MAG TPA: hypothetical protein VNG51_01365 [Ktedonobacteraceae bacterium]|nr:hypothetical protein [Ktedonobacteraceae bacterium]